MQDCIFCKVIDGSIPSQTIYSDDRTIAFLSIQPIRPGHILVIPKIHQDDVFSLNEQDYQAVMSTIRKLAPVLKRVYQPKRMGLMVAGWDVPHAHVHLVPMYDAKDLVSGRILDGSAVVVDNDALQLEKDKILAKLSKS